MSGEKNKTLSEKIDSIKLLSHQEITRLFMEYSKTEDNEKKRIIGNTIAYHNIKLIRDFIIKNGSKLRKSGYDFEELISIGYMGLLEAVERFDLTKGYKFSTFAYIYIRKELFANFFTCKPVIQIKRAATSRIIAYRKLIISYYKEHGKFPSDEQIVKELKISIEGLKRIRLHIKLLYTVSFDEPFKINKGGEETNVKIEDIIASDEEPIDEVVIYTLDKELNRGFNFESLINNSFLTEREKRVVKLRALKDLSFDEIGRMEGLSRETVRKDFINGAKKLKQNKDIIDYKKYGK